MMENRLAAIENLILVEGRQVVLNCIYDGDGEPAEVEKEAVVEAYIQTFGDQPIIVLYWEDGIFKEWQSISV